MSMVAFARILYILLVVLLPIQFITPHAESLAQESVPEQNQVTLTVFFLPEKEACRKNGYVNYDKEQESQCELLTRDDVNRWKAEGRPDSKSVKIPAGQKTPADVSLGEKCFDVADTYPSKPSCYPAERKAVVMVFEWDQPQKGPVSLERKDFSEPARIPSKTWRDNLNGETLWINHSRVDGFFPRSRVQWTLQVGEAQWKFVFKAKE